MTPNASEGNELVRALHELRGDLSRMQARVTDALELAARLAPDAPTLRRCGRCGLGFRSAHKLQEHLYLQHDGPEPAHDGPEPAHWLEAATLAASESDPDPDDSGRLEPRGKAADVNGLTAPESGVEA